MTISSRSSTLDFRPGAHPYPAANVFWVTGVRSGMATDPSHALGLSITARTAEIARRTFLGLAGETGWEIVACTPLTTLQALRDELLAVVGGVILGRHQPWHVESVSVTGERITTIMVADSLESIRTLLNKPLNGEPPRWASIEALALADLDRLIGRLTMVQNGQDPMEIQGVEDEPVVPIADQVARLSPAQRRMFDAVMAMDVQP